MTATCHFFILNRADPANSTSLYLTGPTGRLVTDHPPGVGDLISLSGQVADPADDEQMIEVSDTYRVIVRRLMPASYGSHVWPHGERSTGHEWIDVLIEPAKHDLFDPEATWNDR